MKTVLAALAVALLASACAMPLPCTPVTVAAGIDTQCSAGGSYCGACEGQFCAGTWPFRKDCTTVYPAGSCSCSCR